MPLYVFRCLKCQTTTEILFKTLPSVDKQRKAVCGDCGSTMGRDHAQEPMAVVGGTNFDVQKAAAVAMPKYDQGGRPTPFFKDVNGRPQEVRNSKDIDKWMTNNNLGKPRMVEWTNHVTGAKEWVPQRTVMQADPKTGELLDKGTVIRTTEKLVPLDRKNFTIPRENRRTGTRLDPKTGVAVKSDRPVGLTNKHGKYCNCPPCCMADKDAVTGGTGGLTQERFLPRT